MNNKTILFSVVSLLVVGIVVAYADTPATLKEAYEGAFRIGTAVNSGIVSGRDRASQEIVIAQFNAITAENEM